MWRKMQQQVQLAPLMRQPLFHKDLHIKCIDIANPSWPVSCIHPWFFFSNPLVSWTLLNQGEHLKFWLYGN
jgi:hypothetical protein